MKKFEEYAKKYEIRLRDLLLELARIPAPTGKEERRAQFCLDWLRAHGAHDAYIDCAGNVVWLYQPQGKEEGALQKETHPLVVFDAHMDVVFPDETELPLTERDGRIFCPGVGDDTANLAVLLMMAAYAAKDQPDTGKYGVLFVCGVGEEGLGNLKGVREICREFGTRIAAFYALDLTLDSYTCRAVGSLRYQVDISTKGGHSYSDFGNTNANAVLAELICALYRQQVPGRGTTTYNVGIISGGTSVNTIAQHAELLYEIRSDEERDLQEMEQQFETIIEKFQEICPEDSRIAVVQIGQRPCEHEVDTVRRGWMFRQIERIVEEVSGIRSVPEPCSTDCNIPLSMGIPAVCAGTCRGAGAHTREEYIEADSLIYGLQIGLQLLEEVSMLYE